MNLTALLAGFKCQSKILKDPQILDLTCDSRQVRRGSLFVAISGYSKNGRDYIPDAVSKGAAAILFEGDFFPDLNLPQIQVADARKALAWLSKVFFRDPTQLLYLCGVTGTNGKTTLTYLMESLWKQASHPAGVIGTVSMRYPGEERIALQTTPESRDLQAFFREAVDADTTHMAIEVSSHSLIQRRVYGCAFDSAVFTNLTQDHLDFHDTLEDYYLAKKQLFESLAQSSKQDRIAIICTEDEFGKRLAKELKGHLPVWKYGMEMTNEIHPISCRLSLNGIEAEIQTPGGILKLKSPLLGKFNLLNLMGAIAVALHSKLSLEQIKLGLEKFNFVPGRMQRVPDSNGRLIFVDYAHTPDALKNVLQTLRDLNPPRVVTVFGCGGDRDPSKREPMGYEAGKLSDYCIVTSDNPRTENPKKILDGIIPGLERAGKKLGLGYRIIEDRAQALAEAVSLTKSGEVLIVCGKGHEDYQILGTKKIHFSDVEVLKAVLQGFF